MYRSLDEALEAKTDLTERIQAIESQLSFRAAEMKTSGKVPNKEYKEYLTWRANACFAKSKLTGQLQRTKQWIKAQHIEQTKASEPDAFKLLSRVCNLIDDLVADGVDLNPSEEELIDEINDFLLQRKDVHGKAS